MSVRCSPIIGRSIIMLMWCVVISCSGGDNRSSDTSFSREIRADGVEVIAYQDFPARTLSLDTLHVIDLWSDDVDYHFSGIRQVLGGEESLYLLDSRSKELVHLNLDGTIIRVFGGEGEGPGEFEMPSNLTRIGDAIHVSDVGLRRISVFSMQGVFERDYRWPTGINSIVGRYHVGPEGSLFFIARPSPADQSPSLALIRHTQGGESVEASVDTLLQMQAMPSSVVILMTESGRRVPIFTTPMFMPYLRWDLSGDRLVTVSTLQFRIEFRDLTGRLVRLLTGPGEGFEVTAAVRNRWLTEDLLDSPFGSLFKQLDEAPDRESLDEMPFAEKRQMINGLIVDPLDRIWVQIATEDAGVDRVDMFNMEGEYLGCLGDIGLPETFLDDGSPVFMSYDAENLQYYTVMSIPPPRFR